MCIKIDPTADELAPMLISSARTAKEFGIEPIVANVIYSSKPVLTLRKIMKRLEKPLELFKL